jgi:flagellin
MSLSVNNNQSALIALQNLNHSTDQLNATQTRISTGLKVGEAKDNASIYAIAQKQRASLSALDAVTDSLNRATSIADVASAAGSSISDLLNTLKQKVAAALDPSIDTVSRGLLNNDYKSILSQITKVINNANFDGANVLDGSVTPGLSFLANATANAYVTLSTQNLSLGGTIITIPGTSTIGTSASASIAMAQLDLSITNVNSALAAIGSQANQIEAHNKFVSKLQDALTAGIGNLVDADMAKESARLQALQVQQQLGVQSLSIANQSPQIILSLFKGG